MGEICSKSTTKAPEQRQWRRSGVFIINLRTDFTCYSGVFIIEFVQVNADWDDFLFIALIIGITVSFLKIAKS